MYGVQVVHMCLHVHVHTCVSVPMYIRTYVHTFVTCTYVRTMLHLLKYWSALVSRAALHLPLVLHNHDWIVNREGRSGSEGEGRTTTTNALQQYTTDGGSQVPYGALVLGLTCWLIPILRETRGALPSSLTVTFTICSHTRKWEEMNELSLRLQ